MADDDEGFDLPPVSGAGGVDAVGPAGPPPEIEGYEISGPLGRGGMGAVWRALQQSTRREVALKVLGGAGFGSEKARIRFEHEVELASRLEHPHVARIYDSGLYHGLYYYAMELVDGLPLDEYVKQHGLGRRQVLELMGAVCRAVRYAHQRGVIHRDLKPSNLLVTTDGQPFVLDFGLAKAFVEKDSTAAVSLGDEVVGTPAYMSPEQAAGKADQVDMRSDVYSLGVILYRLLTGCPPHNLEGTRYEVLARVAEEEITRPREVAPGLDREMEALLLKALAKDPDGRYASAGALAEDIDNYLRGDPLSAKAPTTLYFLQKRLRKHWARVAVACGLLSLLVGMAVWSYVRVSDERTAAVAARDEAQQEAAKARAVTDFFNEVLASVEASETRGQPVTVRDLLDRGTRQVEARFRNQPLLEAEIRRSLGREYVALGDCDAASRHLSAALALQQRWLGGQAPKVLETAQDLANALRVQGRAAEAEQMCREVLTKRRILLGPDHTDTLTSMNDLAKALADQDEYPECLALRKEVVERSRRVLGAQAPATLTFMSDLAATLWHTGERSDAARLYREVFEGRRAFLGDEHLDTLTSQENLANAEWRLGQREESVTLYRQLVGARQRVLGDDHPLTAKSLSALGSALDDLGQHDEAESLRREELERRRRVATKGLMDTLAAMNDLANELYWRGKYADAEELHGDVLRLRRRFLGEEDPLTLLAKSNLANDLYMQGKYREAERLHREVLDTRVSVLGENHPDTLWTMQNLANVLHRLREYAEAERLYRQVYEARRQQLGERAPDTLGALAGLRSVLEAQGKQDEARALPTPASEDDARSQGERAGKPLAETKAGQTEAK